MSYVNADGLEILTAGEQGTPAKRGTSLSSQKKSLVMNITGTEVPSSVATPQDHDAFIPAGSYITGAHLIVSTAFTSGGSATLTVGTYTQAGAAVDADGIDATIAVADLAADKAVACNGAAVGGTATVGGADVYVEAIYGTAAFTAGEAKLVIEYIEP
jgi:hypothetical protein